MSLEGGEFKMFFYIAISNHNSSNCFKEITHIIFVGNILSFKSAIKNACSRIVLANKKIKSATQVMLKFLAVIFKR